MDVGMEGKAGSMREAEEGRRTPGETPNPARILIAVGSRDDRGTGDGGFYLRHTYPKAIRAAGGIPMLYGGPIEGTAAADVLAGMGGLLLTGGGDVEPARFGASRHPETGDPELLRDEVEWQLAEAALAMGMPVFGICRGIQLLACVAGGTLIQDIPSERPGSLVHQGKAPRENPQHTVTLDQGTVIGRLLADAAGTETVEVNSFHHQALTEIPAGFRQVAVAPDGIIEAMEREGLDLTTGTGAGYVVGVQWHPEDRWAITAHDRALFETFTAQARRFQHAAEGVLVPER